MRGVQVSDLDEKVGDGIRVGTAEPAWLTGNGANGYVLCVVELGDAICVRIGGAVEGADVKECWRPINAMRREELVEEARSAVEQNGLGSEEEVGIRGFGVLVAIELVLGEDGLIVRIACENGSLVTSVVGECSHLSEVGFIE